MAYISITGLQLRAAWHFPRFMWHASRSMQQALAEDGCLLAEARRISGVHHTRSLWADRQTMLAYLRSGAHAEAMRHFRTIATGKVLGFEADQVPDWPELHRLWRDEGREV